MKPKYLTLTVFYLLLLALNACEDKKEIISSIDNKNYDLAFEFREQGALDSSFYYFNLAKSDFISQSDEFSAGKCIINMAQILLNASDYYSAQELSLQAIGSFDEENPVHFHFIGTNYNTLGGAAFNLHDYPNALKYFEKAVSFAETSREVLVYRNNVAKVYNAIGEYQKAIDVYQSLLENTVEDSVNYARVLTNLANSKFLLGEKGEVLEYYYQGLGIRKRYQDEWGLNSSYQHLSYFFEDKLDSARFYAHHMLKSAYDLNSLDMQIKAYERLVETGKKDSTIHYFKQHQLLVDSLTQIRNTAKNQFAMILYEVEKEKSEKEKWINESEKKSLQILIQNGVFAFVLIIILLISYMYIQNQKKKAKYVKLQAANTLHEMQLKTSKKIHDVIANGLYRLMISIESDNKYRKEEVLDKLEDMYERSREISYDTDFLTEALKSYDEQKFAEELNNMIKSFSSSHTGIFIVGSEAQIWTDLSGEVYFELFHIIQEWMVNMRRHSHATRVVIKFKRDRKVISVEYKDDGIGLSENFIQGNGWKNTETRINNINAVFSFESVKSQGLKYELQVPIK